jgi:hypothetical protein
MTQTMSMGQAAGLAAIQSLNKDEAARELNVQELRKKLDAVGAVLEMPAASAYTGRNDWSKNKTAASSWEELNKRLTDLTVR